MLQNGVDVKAVQEVLGHEHLNTTEIYTHVDMAKQRNVLQTKNPRKLLDMENSLPFGE